MAQFVAQFLKENRPATHQQEASAEEINRSIQSVGIQDTEDPINYRKKDGIRSRTARNWLHKLGYNWQHVKKGVFIDGHERADVVADRAKFLQRMKELDPYLVDFDSSGRILDKTYPNDCKVGGCQRRPIILITHDESIFSANDGKTMAWVKNSDTFLRPKGKGQGIMVSEFLLPWTRLNLKHLPEAELAEAEARGIPLEAVELFEYGKQAGYWDGPCLLKQVTEKALPIAQFLYPGFDLIFLFDNATSHCVYAEDALRVANMGKGEGGQQAFLRPGWYQDPVSGTIVHQPMWTWEPDPLEDPLEGPQSKIRVQKGIQKVLQERGLWPDKGLLLECPKPKCASCQDMIDCRLCIKGTRCDWCKEKKKHSGKCSSQRLCDDCVLRKERCQCVRKEYCPRCSERRTGKCPTCEDLPPKCSSNSKLLLHRVNIANDINYTDCCARRLLATQPDFMGQLCEIEERIRDFPGSEGRHQAMFFPKFHCELSHIEYFWCHGKRYARENCDYSTEALRKVVPLALQSVKSSTILGNYKGCLRKMELYRRGVGYGTVEWKNLTSHQKVYIHGEDR